MTGHFRRWWECYGESPIRGHFDVTVSERLRALQQSSPCLLIAAELDTGDIQLSSLAVPSHLQGQGIGRRAMASLLEIADEAGSTLRLELSEEASEFAGAWYQRLGFVFTGECGEWGEIAMRPPQPTVSPRR